jgi:hypothetical protein
MRYDPSSSILAGYDPTQAAADLQTAQKAYVALCSGQQVVTVSYTQGDGSKSVTYRQTDIANLVQLIKQLQAQLGIVARPRRALTPRF